MTLRVQSPGMLKPSLEFCFFGHKSLVSLLGPFVNLSMLQTPLFQFGLKLFDLFGLTGHKNLHSLTHVELMKLNMPLGAGCNTTLR